MTVRLLKPYAQRPFNAIATFDAGTEAGLIAAGQASADLTGGVRYFVERSAPAVQSKQAASGKVSLKFEEMTTMTLPEGQVLLISGAASTTGAASRLGSSDTWTVGTGALAAIGPYAGTHKIRLTCTTGSIDATVADAVLTLNPGGSYTLPVATTAQLGGMKPDNVTLIVDPGTGLASAQQYALPAASTAQLGGLKPDNVTIIVDPTTGAATSPVTPNYKLLPKFAAAVSKARTGVKRAKVMLVSDSNGIGYGSGSDGTTAAARYSANSRKNSFLAQLARLMTQYFCNASFQGFAGSGNLQNAGELAQFDPRFASPVAGWTPIAEKDGMLPFSSATDGHKMTFTPDVPVDNFVLDWKSTPYGATAAGSFSYQVDAGAVVTVDALTEFGPRTIAAGSLGAHTLSITKVGAQRAILLTLDAYNSTVPGIDMMLYGYNGGTGAEYTNGTGCLAKMAGYASDLTFLMLMTNEMGANSSTGTFKTNQQKIITNAKLTGDVLLITPPPLSPTGSTYPRTLAEQLVYINIYRDLARENGIQILDLWSRWVNRDAGGLLGYYNGSGDLHPSMVGNADIASFIFKSITAI